MKNRTLHLIGNAHLDPVWLWQWQEGFQAAKATFRSALDRLKEYDEFLFTSSSAAIYEWIEGHDPALFAEIQERVAEGRWCLCGGWWIQPDCNLPGGESFVRQGLYGQRYFQEKFGVVASVGYNVDSFGHHGALPQILKKSGLDYYVFMRPGPHEKELPGRLFWWKADDGSRVLTCRLPDPYCTGGAELEEHVQRCAAAVEHPPGALMCFYGVGNHGGGPTRANIESLRRLRDRPEGPTLLFSTPERFFREVAAQDLELPVVHDELQHHASGCYAAHSGIKRWNRQAENRLLAAEKLAVLAQRLAGRTYPNDLGRAWKNLLFCQFHDILAGTSLPSAYDDARDLLGETAAIADRARNDAVQALSGSIQIAPEEGMTPIVVFNPHGWNVRTDVELEFGSLGDSDALVDDQGNEVALQTVQSEATVSRWRRRLCFIADLPALGYRTYRVCPKDAQREFAPVTGDDHVLESERFRLEVDPATGGLAHLWDKAVQVEAFRGAAATPLVLEDTSDTWSHGVLRFDTPAEGAFTVTRIRRVEQGPVKSVLRVQSAYGMSRLTQEFTLYRELDQIDVHVTVDWREQHKMLKLCFPVNVQHPTATYEIPYGHIERPMSGEEEPGQSWVDLTGRNEHGDRYGVSLLNDGKYSFSAEADVMMLTVLRSPIYAHHDPFVPQPDDDYFFIDQGIQRFTYTLLPHAEGWEQAGTVRRAAERNQRPIPIVESYHDGPLQPSASLLSVEPDNIILDVLKKAEEDDALILRCRETAQVATRATIRLPWWHRVVEATFGPCEIKTFRIPRDVLSPVVETDLLERPVDVR